MRGQGIFTRLLVICAVALMASLSLARAETNIVPTLAVEQTSANALSVAIVMRPKPGWHGYWKNPGDAGFPNEFVWELPAGISAGPLRYPAPERLNLNGLMNHVYNGEHALVSRLSLPANIKSGDRLKLTVKARWLACTDRICVPEQAMIAADYVLASAPASEEFGAYLSKLARPLGSDARFSVEGNKVRIAIPLPINADPAKLWFFAETENLLGYSAKQQFSQSDGDIIVETDKAAFGFTNPSEIRGVLALGDGQGFEIVAKPGAVAGARAAPSLWWTSLLALLGAIAGGVLLNIMPCVFPIISLKALAMARAGGDERTVKAEAIAYSAGVIATCLALGGALLALRAGGASVGWAFQLQDPRVILFLFLLCSAITLNLAGAFAFKGFASGDALASQGGRAGAFWTGALAAFVATPCTGPFMAAALGAALVLPTVAALAIFAGLGLGLALPFLLLAYWPALRSRLPKPGPWMVRFQRWMAIPMGLTSLALAWLLSRQTGAQGLIIASAILLALAAMILAARRLRPFGIGLPVALAALGVLTAVAAPVLPTRNASSSSSLTIAGAEPFSEARLDALRVGKRPVFVYFTADWCVTCKINEKVALQNADVIAAFKAKKIVLLVGDWTSGDAAISRFLEKHGRSGVPFYLFYPANGAEPQILPQLLTPAMLTTLG